MMMLTWLCVGLLFTLWGPCWARDKRCPASASDCNTCIQSHPDCAWCSAPGVRTRCNTAKRHRRGGCSDLHNPQGSLRILRNEPRSSDGGSLEREVLLEPQELSLQLRPGVAQSFHLAVSSDQPTEMDTSGAPEGLNITFTHRSKDVRVNVHLEAAHCRYQNRTGPWSVQITPRGLPQSLKLTVEVECECECMKNREERSPSCRGRGALQCGVCRCDRPYLGERCESDPGSRGSNDACHSRPGSPVCSGNGECVDGSCECRLRENPSERYSGMFCECDNFNCPVQNGRMCGGRGTCECGECLCDDGWTGEDCACLMDPAPCMAANQQICNGRGICECGQCQCNPPYGGRTCEDCPSCRNVCEEHAACVECRAFGTGPKKNTCEEDCGGLVLRMVDSGDDMNQGGTGRICRMYSRDDSCTFNYSIERTPAGELATVQSHKRCPRPL